VCVRERERERERECERARCTVYIQYSAECVCVLHTGGVIHAVGIPGHVDVRVCRTKPRTAKPAARGHDLYRISASACQD